MTEEMVLYLLSFSGLKRIAISVEDYPATSGYVRNMFLKDVLQKHVDSLQTLRIDEDCKSKWVKPPCYTLHVTFSNQVLLTGFQIYLNGDHEMS
jgi:hypothetical protein